MLYVGANQNLLGFLSEKFGGLARKLTSIKTMATTFCVFCSHGLQLLLGNYVFLCQIGGIETVVHIVIELCQCIP